MMLMAWGASAHVDDTIKMFYANVPIMENMTLAFTGYSNAVIIPDSVNYVTFADPLASTTKLPTLSSSGTSEVRLFEIASKPGTPRLVVHLDISNIREFVVKDYSQVVMPCLRTEKLVVSASDWSQFSVTKVDESDSLVVDCLKCSADDYSQIHLDVPMRWVTREELSSSRHGVITLLDETGKTVNYNEVKSAERKFTVQIPSVDSELGVTKKRKSTSRVSSGAIRFLWGFNNWGDQPYSGFSKMAEPYALHTSFSNYQLESNYRVLNGRYWHIGGGFGYSSEVYKFDNTLPVILADGEAGGHQFCTDDAQGFSSCATRLVARYITMPLEVIWTPRTKLHLSLTVIPGVNLNTKHTGLKYKYVEGGKTMKDYASTSSVMNPFKCDVRFAIGNNDFKLFVQPSLVPIFEDMPTKIYPIRFGIQLGE